MSLIVQKYGGTSVGNVDRIKNVARRVAETYDDGNDVIVVVSAMGDSTDELIDLAHQISEMPSRREMDRLLSTGEQVTISLLTMALHSLGYNAISLTGPQVGIVTEGHHTRAKIAKVNTDRIKAELSQKNIIVVAGFQGVDENNDVTTLGRGGSDTTAVALAAAVHADLCEIFTDVDGVYTSDPRYVKKARKLDEIGYDEMLEMAVLGAGVLQARSVECAMLHEVVVSVRSSFNNNPGTLVRGGNLMEKKMVVRGVAKDVNVAKLAIIGVPDSPGMAFKIFNALGEEGVSIDMIIQSVNTDKFNDILFTVNTDDLKRSMAVLEKIAHEINAEGIKYDEKVAKVSIIGAGVSSTPGIAARMFEALAENEINIQAISSSEIKISCLIEQEKVDIALNAIHNKFFFSEEEDEIELS